MWKKYLLDMEPTMRLILCDYLYEQKNTNREKNIKKLNTIKTELRKKYETDNSLFDFIDSLKSNDSKYILEQCNIQYLKDTKIGASALKQMNSYIELSNTKFGNVINNETIMKEILFTCPTESNQIDPDVLVEITKDFMNNFYKDYNIILMASHRDESTSHIHIDVSGRNKISNRFDILKHQYELVNTKYELNLNASSKDDQKRFGELQQEMYYEFINQHLSKRNLPLIEFKTYVTDEEKAKRKEIIEDSKKKITERDFNGSKLQEKEIKKLDEQIEDKKEFLRKANFTIKLADESKQFLQNNEMFLDPKVRVQIEKAHRQYNENIVFKKEHDELKQGQKDLLADKTAHEHSKKALINKSITIQPIRTSDTQALYSMEDHKKIKQLQIQNTLLIQTLPSGFDLNEFNRLIQSDKESKQKIKDLEEEHKKEIEKQEKLHSYILKSIEIENKKHVDEIYTYSTSLKIQLEELQKQDSINKNIINEQYKQLTEVQEENNELKSTLEEKTKQKGNTHGNNNGNYR
jgi:hypothetical protein